MRLTDSAIAHGFAAAITERLDLFVAYGRGERARTYGNDLVGTVRVVPHRASQSVDVVA